MSDDFDPETTYIISPVAEEDENPAKKNKTENRMDCNGLVSHLHSLPKRDDYTLQYFFAAPVNIVVAQADRDFVAQALDFYSARSKRDTCPAVATVTAALAADVQGVTTDRTADTSIKDVFKTVKQIIGFCSYVQQTRAAHNYVIVNLSVDGSPFFQII